MAGTRDRGSLMENWMPPTPSPRTLMSSFLNEEFSSGPFSSIFSEHGSNKPQDQSEKSRQLVDLSEEVPAQSAKTTFQKDISLEPNLFNSNQKSNSHSGLAERMAARAGFSIPKIDTSRVGSSTVIQSPVAIPPGLSPTTLLESPIFLYNAMAQPSPTTGKLPFLMATNAKSTIPPAAKMTEDCAFGNDVFSFQPYLGSKAPSLSTVEKGYDACHQYQSLSNIHQQESSLQSSFTAVKDTTDETIVKPKTSDSMFGDNHSSADEEEDDETNQNGEYSSAAIGTPAEDGYNWRKYGQQQVKNSEHPRSYYKCTHPKCPVKKKVERSQDGQITEIIYKGTHNHPLPPPNRRSGVPFSHINDQQINVIENPGLQAGLTSASLWENAKNGCLQDVQSDGVEARPAACFPVSAYGDTSMMESQDAVDVSSTLSNEEDEGATPGTISIDCDADEDETESKRRKLDALATATITTAATNSTIDMGAAASRAVREPRVVVQTTSEFRTVMVIKLFWVVMINKLFWTFMIVMTFRTVMVIKLFWVVMINKLFWAVMIIELFHTVVIIKVFQTVMVVQLFQTLCFSGSKLAIVGTIKLLWTVLIVELFHIVMIVQFVQTIMTIKLFLGPMTVKLVQIVMIIQLFQTIMTMKPFLGAMTVELIRIVMIVQHF